QRFPGGCNSRASRLRRRAGIRRTRSSSGRGHCCAGAARPGLSRCRSTRRWTRRSPGPGRGLPGRRCVAQCPPRSRPPRTRSAGTPEGPWLRTGDLGFFSDGRLFIVGRIKDLLIVYGRNHAPDDIEATISEITGGRVAAIAVPRDGVEQLVAVIEFKKRGDSDEEVANHYTVVKREVTSAMSKSHGLAIADLVLVAPGSIPITTSGKVRRQSCAEEYRGNRFARLDA